MSRQRRLLYLLSLDLNSLLSHWLLDTVDTIALPYAYLIIISWLWPKLSTTAFPDIPQHPPGAVVWLHVHFPRTFVQCLAYELSAACRA